MGNFIFFVLALLTLAALLRIDFFFTILYLFVGVYILSHMWSRHMLQRLHFQRKMVRRAFSGDMVTVTLEITNASRLPVPWLLLKESFPTEFSATLFREVITLRGKTSHKANYTLAARKRGYYKIGPLFLETGDILGLRRELTARFPANYLIVYPRIVPISQLGLPTHSPQVILPTQTPMFQDPARLIGVRNYSPGDNPRHIHWPATAATGQMLVKQFEPAIARENAIFLNLDRADYAKLGYPITAMELAIIVAASLASHIITVENLPVGLVTTGLDPLSDKVQSFRLPPQKGRNHLMQLLEVLARVQFRDETHFLKQLRHEAIHLSWGTTLIIITSHITEELQENILFLKRSGFRATLILVNPPRSRVKEPSQSSQELQLPVFKVRSEKDIEVWAPST